jgi:hypothetical protein
MTTQLWLLAAAVVLPLLVVRSAGAAAAPLRIPGVSVGPRRTGEVSHE